MSYSATVETLQNSRIFITESGRIGIAPKETQIGDLIRVVGGTFAPLLLRKRLESGWSLVSGDCFLPEELDYDDNGDGDGDSLTKYVEAHKESKEVFDIW